MSTLLKFHKSILENIYDPATSELVVLARGLGLRRILTTLLKIYDSPQSLVLLINATPEEESEIGEELGIMGCRRPGLRVVGYEFGSKDRNSLYKSGGLISVTSRILVVDMLQGDIPVDKITGIMVLHAEKRVLDILSSFLALTISHERVTPLVTEAFIVRLYREKNKTGFLKAFTDQPEHITSGLSPLRNIMKELQLRKVHIYPRFHEEIKQSLERRRADVVELSQQLTEQMSDIHHAITQCMTTTLSELKRANTQLDLDDFNADNAYFRQFDVLVRKQLDPVWNKVGPRTKQLVSDLGTLRRLLYYLLTYDPLQFHAYLETIIAANTISSSGSSPRQHHSPWLLTDAANVIFQAAKRRCYTMSSTSKQPLPQMLDELDDEDHWEALAELEGRIPAPDPTSNKGKGREKRPKWLPEGMDPVLEELPKWTLLGEVLKEIEEEMMRQEALGLKQKSAFALGSNTVLIMTSSTRTCSLVTEFLSSMDADAPPGTRGRTMMMRKLRTYLWWKRKLGEKGPDVRSPTHSAPRHPILGGVNREISEALKKKDKEKADRLASRRRVRGGAPSADIVRTTAVKGKVKDVNSLTISEKEMRDEADAFADMIAFEVSPLAADMDMGPLLIMGESNEVEIINFSPQDIESQFNDNYGLLAPEETVLVRAYSDDSDDRMLAEIQPRFIVMFEPSMEFIRRIEVYRSASPGMGIRVYHMIYQNSCEEHKYLASIRREKESFERLIKERGTMLTPILEDTSHDSAADSLLRTISTRIAGGRRELNKETPKVIVDMREFRSTLPSLLHASRLLVIPATLTVGDYVLTPDICVERKSLSDLISSFNSGRLYTQCELMSVHYKHPILLIEFEEDKAFSLDIVSDMKSYAKPSGKYPPKKTGIGGSEYDSAAPSLQSKIVLLTLTFPRVRIIWSSSPYATSEIFNDLKLNNYEPDVHNAISIGSEEDPDAGSGINSAAEELLRCLPGITAKNVKYVMNKIRNVRQLCEMELSQVQEILGAEPGKACYEFLHKGGTK